MSGKTPNSILTPLQQDLLSHLKNQAWFIDHFYLTGGTALSAYYLFHRLSDDLDFFTHEPLPERLDSTFLSFCKASGFQATTVKKSPMFIRFTINQELQIDVVQDIATRFGIPLPHDGIPIDSLENIAVNKIGTILSRLEIKDYIDLYFLITEKKFDVFELIEKAKKKDGGCDAFIWSRLIGDVESLVTLPRMIKPLDVSTLHKFYKDLQKKILKSLKPHK